MKINVFSDAQKTNPNKPNFTDFTCPKGATNFDKLSNTNPITEMLKMNVNKVLTKDYENKRLHRRAENKPKQTQFKPSARRAGQAIIYYCLCQMSVIIPCITVSCFILP